MKNAKRPDVDRILREGTEITSALERAARQARFEHKLRGIPLVVWIDGKTVHVPPEQIVVDLVEPAKNAPRDS